jgi:hypothetical protein
MRYGEQLMTDLTNKAPDPAEAAKDREPAVSAADDDPCRCKQVSVMTPRELLGTMLSDLAFWKKKR